MKQLLLFPETLKAGDRVQLMNHNSVSRLPIGKQGVAKEVRAQELVGKGLWLRGHILVKFDGYIIPFVVASDDLEHI